LKLTPAQLGALARAERGRAESAKAAARVVHDIDKGAPRSAAQLSAELKGHGLELSDQAVRHLRYIARLLKTLDPVALDPPELKRWQDPEVLYRLQRVSEVTHADVAELVGRLIAEAPESPRDWLGAMLKARTTTVDPEAKQLWQAVLPKVPVSIAKDANKAFAAWTKAQDLTPMTAVQALTTLIQMDAEYNLHDHKGSRSALNEAFAEWASSMRLTPGRAAALLVLLLTRLPLHHWETLAAAVTTPDNPT
jgi:hypothetical protein